MTTWLPSMALLVWSVRDLARRPWEAVLSAAALAALVVVGATALLLTQAVSETGSRMLADAPALVVRRINAGGWAPMPVDDTVSSAAAVAGVIAVRPRIWGVVGGPERPLTLVGTPESLTSGLAVEGIVRPPSRGEVILGPGVDAGDFLQLTGAARLTLEVVGRMNPAAGMVTHDLVLTHPDDARRLLGIGAGYVSDLTVDVFHDQEIEAIVPDLARAFPWPVQISTRRQAIAQFSGGLMRRGGLVCLALVPAVLALALILAGRLKHAAALSREAGLLKAFGWTTTDLVHLHLVQAVLTGLASVMVGLWIAYALVFWPGATWPGQLFFGWRLRSPALCLDTAGATPVLAVIGALVFLPYLAASLWPVLRAAAVDPVDVIQRDYV
jgi:hypothetical protein